jgi:hypothetical protein
MWHACGDYSVEKFLEGKGDRARELFDRFERVSRSNERLRPVLAGGREVAGRRFGACDERTGRPDLRIPSLPLEMATTSRSPAAPAVI